MNDCAPTSSIKAIIDTIIGVISGNNVMSYPSMTAAVAKVDDVVVVIKDNDVVGLCVPVTGDNEDIDDIDFIIALLLSRLRLRLVEYPLSCLVRTNASDVVVEISIIVMINNEM
jgi:hypothetical protein